MPVVGASTNTWGTSLNSDLTVLDTLLAGEIYGLDISTAGGSTSFGVSAGAANGMSVASAYTKSTSSWAVGSGNGSLDTGTAAVSTTYHMFIIQRPDTGINDFCISLSPTAPTTGGSIPSAYTRFRRIGSRYTDSSGNWPKTSQIGDEVLLGTYVNDVSLQTSGVLTALTPALSVPTGIQVNALFSMKVLYSATAANFVISALDQTDNAPSNSNYSGIVSSTSQICTVPANIRTSTSGTIRARFAAIDLTYDIVTRGWIDTRGRLG